MPHGHSYDDTTAHLDLDNDPGALLRIDEEVGGPSRISDDYVEGPPGLIVGVAHSSAESDTTECSSKCAAHDLHDQKRAYRRNGVQECLGRTIKE
jgi:hypothetical protein